MKILFLDWNCFGKKDTINAFRDLGHEVFLFAHDDYNHDESESFDSAFDRFVENYKIDICFSYNFYPLMAENCYKLSLKYISIVYDSPYVMLYSFTEMYPTNYIFLFDSSWVEELRSGGLKNVFYTVLPGNADRIDRIKNKSHDSKRLSSDVSFVGALYNEKHNLYERLEDRASAYLKGYLNGIVEAQQKIYGYSLVEDLLTEDILAKLRDSLDAKPNKNYAEPPKYRYANYFIKRKITQVERIRLLSSIGQVFGGEYDIKLFTLDKNIDIKGISNMGVANYENEMPYVFNESRINLNISLRSIHTGIPLRCIDIMSNGGFLLSNYQSDLLVDFVPKEDFDYFESPDDMLSKIEYYLTHENERKQIALNGKNKIKELYSHKKILSNIMSMVLGS